MSHIVPYGLSLIKHTACTGVHKPSSKTEVFIGRFVTELGGGKQNPDVLRQDAFIVIIVLLETKTLLSTLRFSSARGSVGNALRSYAGRLCRWRHSFYN